jgi:hypothetical protein
MIGMQDDDDPRTRLRTALNRGDDEALLLMLRKQPWPRHSLQTIGDALNGALARRGDDAQDLARDCIAELRRREWEGDRELAATLESRLGAEPAPLLRPLRVDLESLSMALEGDPVEGVGGIHLRTGEVWPQPAVEYAKETGEIDEADEDDPERWLWFGSGSSHDGYRDMELFIGSLDDPDNAMEGYAALPPQPIDR